MPSRLSKIFGGDKEKETLAEAERSRSSYETPPPTYGSSGYDHDHVLNPPDLTAGFNSLNLEPSSKDDFPTVDESVAHLKVLECFYRLKQRIGSSDGLFGIHDSIAYEYAQYANCQDKAPELLSKLAEKRWAIYTTRAVDRFATWAASISPAADPITIERLRRDGPKGMLCKPKSSYQPLRFDRSNMPPADVLMVWHAYMLNPRAYLEDCLRLGRMAMWHTRMPWSAAVACINSGTFQYEVDEVAKLRFASITSRSWDNPADADSILLNCPTCLAETEVNWTTCPVPTKSRTAASFEAVSDIIDKRLSEGTGFCDKDLLVHCPSCYNRITHETLKAGKFLRDVDSLLERHIPMGGTLLGMSGIPGKVEGQKDITFEPFTEFPNNLLLAGLGQRMTSTRKLIRGAQGDQGMEGVRSVIEEATEDSSYMRRVRSSLSHRLQRTEKIALRRMMSRYWENSSAFALDLVGAVVRQSSFIEKMHGIDWLHSPALPSTMGRLLTKYERFVGLMADRRSMAVPTLDVDLAWHTHQLSPRGYMHYTVKVTKQFIDHDDKVAETALNDGFAWTSKTYQRLYGEPYSECTCWYCEAVRESHTSTASRLFNSSSARANEMLHSVDQDPAKSVHISAHNAVRPSDDTGKYQLDEKRKQLELDAAYQKACERARKKGRREPKRDDYYYSDAYGYPVYIPAYAPYVGFMPYSPYYYPIAPGCMALGAGMAGNCCSGTCGGGVAAGSCGGGGGAGTCAGGAAGGCGGGGG
nr:glycine-rich domain-containing protein 1 [Quercus suber]